MQDVLKIVTDRLGAAAPVVNHPDADVLTAFHEGALPPSEKAIVVEHLALCGDCREIVFLAQPAAEETQAVIRPAPSGWLSWPALRWGFVALGVFAIASVGVLQYRRQSGSSSMAYLDKSEGVAKEAKNQAPPPPAAAQLASDQEKKVPAAPVPAAAPAVAPAGTGQLHGNAQAEFDRLESFPRPQNSVTRDKKVNGMAASANLGKPLPHGPDVQYQNAYSFQNNAVAQKNVQNGRATVPPAYAKQAPNSWMNADASPPTSSETVEVQSGQQQVQGRNTQDLQLESKTMPMEPAEGGQGRSVEKAKEPGVVFSSRSKAPAASPQPPDAFTGALSPPNASWTISAGGLQRSLDQGKTWQNVNVEPSPATGASLALAVQPARATSGNKDSALKQQATLPTFRAVVANGSDVWAGGASGLLYHSVDSGTHWTRVLPSSGSASLAGDVVSLDFPDTLHGRVTTSTPEVWLTSDGGQTWQKQ